MSEPLVYVDRSDVREGALDELKTAIRELAEFVEAHEPQLISYSVYFGRNDREMAVVQIHADAASLDVHLDVAGSRFERFADLVALRSIDIYGEPSESALAQLRDKLRLLGAGEVVVHVPHAGFGRARAPAAG
jgi:hypothetical protein